MLTLFIIQYINDSLIIYSFTKPLMQTAFGHPNSEILLLLVKLIKKGS